MEIGETTMHNVPALHPHAVRYAERDAAHNPLQKVLVVIDPAATTHPCIEKAARIALAFGSSVELFSCEVQSDLPEMWAGGTSLAAYRGVLRERQVAALEALAKPLRERGLSVATESVCSERLEEAIVERAIRTEADLVVKDVQRHPPRSRAPSMQIDWLLIREVPVPLLLARPALWPPHPRVCVAVDPCHPADRPPALDEAMIATGSSLGRALSGAVDIVHTLQSPPHLPGESVAPAVEHKAHAHARAAVEDLAHRTGIPHEAIHFLPERVPEGILQLAESMAADLVVMGAGGRPRFQYSAASTASLVLDQLSCDLLIVKAPGFVSPVLEE
jgi:nucleotide-binding universal stress UspA family protein